MPLLANDLELLQRFRRGDLAALEQVYRAYIDRVERVVRFGFGLTANPQRDYLRVPGADRHEIADLVQEVFTRAFTAKVRRAYDGKREYGPFIVTIARNLLVDRARRLGRDLPLDTLSAEPAAPEVEADFADEATMSAVSQYLASLPADLRGVHEQRYVHCVSQEEAATHLGLTRQRVRTLEGKLRQGLADALTRAGIGLDDEQQPIRGDLRIARKET